MGGLTASRRRAASTAAVALAIATVLALGVPATPVLAADPTFGTPTIDGRFGDGVRLTQPVTLDAAPYRAEVVITTGLDGVPLVVEVPTPSAGRSLLDYTLGGADGHLYPNTPVSARWRIQATPDSEPVLGPVVETVYDDDRFDWQTVEGDVVRVHWYEGPRSFGERALRIGEAAVAETTELLGVSEDEPIDFFIYADRSRFYDALGPGTRENVGGQANSEIRTLFALISPREIDDPWVSTVVPHELVHLVFDTAVSNPYHFPPRWLNEGLAMYRSEGYAAAERATVEAAARSGDLIPLEGLGGQFPTTADGFYLAYAESVSAVDFLVRTHGQDSLLALIRAYREGVTDEEAFQAAIGQDMAAFDAAWQADLGADPPVRYGPQPAPRGPQPSAWMDDDPAGPTPTATRPPAATDPGAPTAAPSTMPGRDIPGDDGAASSLPLLMVVTALVVVAIGWLVRARSRRGGSA